MEAVSFKNNYYENNSENLKRLDNQESFTALDKEQLKADAVELSSKAQKEVKENWFFRMLRNTFGVEDPKKLMKSIGLAVATTIGLAVLGNKLTNKSVELGTNFDKAWSETPVYKWIHNAAGSAKKWFSNNVVKKSKTLSDISETMQKRRSKPKCDWGRGYGRGFVSIFSLTPVDTIQKAFKKAGINGAGDLDKATDLMKKLVGDTVDKEGASLAEKLAKSALGIGEQLERRDFCSQLSDGMRKYSGCGSDHKKFLKALESLKKDGTFMGNKITEFTDVPMVEKGISGIIGSWWPVNMVQSLGKKIGSQKMANFCKGNLGDSLIKFNAVNGSLADTKLGSLAQKSIIVPTESISNFVNDKSGLGFFLCGMCLIPLFNNVQDAPKNKKAATLADDFMGTIGSIAIATPLAFGTTYGLASLRNLEGKTIFSKILKPIGKFFGMGLDTIAKDGSIKPLKQGSNQFTNTLLKGGRKVKGFAGGAMRLAMIMFILGPLFSKPIKAAIHKVFGKPYDKNEELKKQQEEAQMNAIIPELGISQKELMEKIEKNPAAIERLQKDEKLGNYITQNPKKLIDLLDGKEVNPDEQPQKAPQTSSGAQSPLLQSTIAKQKAASSLGQNNLDNRAPEQNNLTNEAELFSSKEKKEPEQKQEEPLKDSATYIPSSKFKAKSSYMSDEKQREYDAQMERADKVLARAEKFI